MLMTRNYLTKLFGSKNVKKMGHSCWFMVGSDLLIGVCNCVEQHGHDDSLPYYAEIYAYNISEKKLIRIGSAMNDGWGGISDIRIGMDYCDLFNEFSELVKHFGMVLRGGVKIPKSFDDAIDLMVVKAIYSRCYVNVMYSYELGEVLD